MTSVALTGAVNEVASQLMDVIAEARNDPEQLLPSALTTARVFDFLYVLPRGTALPEATLDPDGEVGLDWMISKNRILSVSIGESNRISYAWHDGTDRGHAAVTFDGRKLPSHLMTLLTEMGLNATSAVRAA